MIDKRGFEFSFAWMFAIIVGAVIIFLAIFAATRVVDTERFVSDTEVGKQLGVILNPIETGIEDGRVTRISLPGEARVFNSCDTRGAFGRQGISVAQKSGVGENAWGEPGVENAFFNKYIFSESVVEGKSLEVFSKPVNFPFKTANVIYMWSENERFCFVNPESEVEDEIRGLNIRSINITSTLTSCDEGDIKVCFDSTAPDCDISVSLEGKFVNKRDQGTTVYYDDTFGKEFLYGAIFTDSETYECQVKRIMKRNSELSLLYLEKAKVLKPRGCSFVNIESDLEGFALGASGLSSSFGLNDLGVLAKGLGGKNDDLICKLF